MLTRGLSARGHDVEVLGPASLAQAFDGVAFTPVESPYGEVDLPDADVHVVDFMLTPTLRRVRGVALVHTLYASILRDGVPHPMGMLGPTDPAWLAQQRLVLVTCPAVLDGGRDHGNVRYAGPLVPEAEEPWTPPDDGRPLVAVSLGTTAGLDEEPVLANVVEALGDLEVTAIVNVGDHVDRGALPSRPNVHVTGFVPHAAVLPHAALLVTHAGLGSVNAALVAGTPMLCLPLDREQPDNARAVERLGAGRSLPRDASPAAIGEAVSSLLGARGVRIEPTNRAFHHLQAL